MRIRRLAALVAIVVLVAIPAAAVPTVAAGGSLSLTERQYIAEQGPVQRSGFWGSQSTISDQAVLSIGYIACGLHKQGLSDLEVLTAQIGYTPPPKSQAYIVGMDGVRDAVRFICP